jgi:hypothetical protein
LWWSHFPFPCVGKGRATGPKTDCHHTRIDRYHRPVELKRPSGWFYILLGFTLPTSMTVPN